MNSVQYRARMHELMQSLQKLRTQFDLHLALLQKQNLQANSVDTLRTVSHQSLLLFAEFHEHLIKLQAALKVAQEQFEQAQAGSIRSALLSY
ncbi:MAG: hypothetical protein ACD_69C00271G0004 [uncultured bacterium]|nr:MAG: hypothetical protein ACD_69C00271G0004 [uncultured bacterium]